MGWLVDSEARIDQIQSEVTQLQTKIAKTSAEIANANAQLVACASPFAPSRLNFTLNPASIETSPI